MNNRLLGGKLLPCISIGVTPTARALGSGFKGLRFKVPGWRLGVRPK